VIPSFGVPSQEENIRTLGIGLVAIAAVMVSLTLVKQRNEARQPEPEPTPGRAPATTGMNLDAIRTAGL
jgi:hypothetical protein